jgi:hypothetical protein
MSCRKSNHHGVMAMSQPLDYAAPPEYRPSRALARAANVTAALPLMILALLYGHWLLAWAMLGHRPQPSLNDPWRINGLGLLQLIVALLLLSFPMCGRECGRR